MSKHKTRHTCLFCSKEFAHYDYLERHMLSHTEENPHDCPFCHQEFRRTDYLARHQKICQLKPKKRPPLCKKTKEVETGDKDDEKRKENHVQKDCSIQSEPPAPKSLAQSSSSRAVVRNADGRFECDSCPVTFSAMSNLYKHKRYKRCKGKGVPNNTGNRSVNMEMDDATTTTLPERFKCDKCSDTLSSLHSLNRHQKSKRCEERQRKAKLAMRRPPSLKMKFEIVSRYRIGSFVCGKCNRKFNWYTSLRRHISTETCTRETKCDVCQVTFNSHAYLSRHKRSGRCTRSPDAKEKEKLKVSSKKYATRNLRKSGLSSPVDKPEEMNVTRAQSMPRLPSATSSKKPRARCVKCSSLFISRDALKQHYIESHDMKLWNCKLCPDWYCRLDGLQRHMRDHHKRKMDLLYLCKLCEQKFATLDMLKNHGKKFHAKKNYECGVCHYTYVKATSLRKHVRKTGHCTEDEGGEKLLGTKVKAPNQEKKINSERKSQRVTKPVTPFSPSVSPVKAKTKRPSSPSPDITQPKFYTATTTTATKPKSHKKLGSKEKPKLKRSKPKSRSTSGSSNSLLRPPVFQFNINQVFSPPPLDAECPKLEFLSSPVTSPQECQIQNLRHDILNRFHQQQQQKKSQNWDESFFLHMNRYKPES